MCAHYSTTSACFCLIGASPAGFIVIKSGAFSIHFNGCERGKLTDVCNNGQELLNERLKFLAILRNGPYIGGHLVIYFKLNF